MSKAKAYLLIISAIFMVGYGCHEQQPKAAPPANTVSKHTYTEKGSVREMTIQPDEIDFPEHDGKAEFVSYCGICHSLKYITGQPAFPRTTWAAEVHKMIEKYGAPIDSAKSEKIVDYLVAINGIKS